MRYLVLLVFFALPLFGEAAVLGVTPQSQDVTVGEQFSVVIVADTEGYEVTAVEGELAYDPAVLEPMLVSTAGSAFSMWATEPDVSVPGTIQFSGWASAPQAGAGLTVVTVSFRATQAGTHALSIPSGALLANDGKSSNIISTLGRAQVSVLLKSAGVVLGASTLDTPPMPPTFSVHTTEAGDRLLITGESEPGSRVVFTLEGPKGSQTLKADAPHGAFALVGDRLSSGEYRALGEAYSASGLLSTKSEESFTVGESRTALAAAFLGSPSYLTALVGLLSFVLGFAVYRLLAKIGYLP